MKQRERHYGLTDAFYDNSMKQHGILGQKWGIRRFQNPDGSLTPAGRERYGYGDYKRLQGFEGLEERMNLARSANQHLGKELEKMHNADKICQDVMKDFGVGYEYGAVSGIANAIMDNFKYSIGGGTMRDIAEDIWFYACEDGDQGAVNAYTCYLVGNNKVKSAKNALDNFESVEKDYSDKVEQHVRNVLGPDGERASHPGSKYYDTTIAEEVARDAKDLANGKNTYGWWDGATPIKNALADIKDPKDPKMNAAVNQARFIVNKIGNLDKYPSVSNIMDAVEEVGIGDKNFKDMTDADWKNLSERVAGYNGIYNK